MLTTQKALDNTLDSIWNQCLEKIEDKVGPHSFETWFRSTNLSYTSDNNPCIEVPNRFFADFIEEHYCDLIKEVLSEQGVNTASLTFVPTEKDWNIIRPVSETITKTRENLVPKKVINTSTFHPDYTFDKFVVGDNNRFAFAPCLAVSEANVSCTCPSCGSGRCPGLWLISEIRVT